MFMGPNHLSRKGKEKEGQKGKEGKEDKQKCLNPKESTERKNLQKCSAEKPTTKRARKAREGHRSGSSHLSTDCESQPDNRHSSDRFVKNHVQSLERKKIAKKIG